MMTTILFGGYLVGLGGVCYNLSRTKLQDDFHQEIQNLREYDLDHDSIQFHSAKPIKCIILAKIKPSS